MSSEPAKVHCDLCLISSWRVKILRFSLIMSRRPTGERKTSRGAGAILLCEDCWSRGPGKRRLKKPKCSRVGVL